MYTEEHDVAFINGTWTDGVSVIFTWTRKQEWLHKKTRFHKHGSVTAEIFRNMDQAKYRSVIQLWVTLSEAFAEVVNFCPFLISNLDSPAVVLKWRTVTKQLHPAIVAEHLCLSKAT